MKNETQSSPWQEIWEADGLRSVPPAGSVYCEEFSPNGNPRSSSLFWYVLNAMLGR